MSIELNNLNPQRPDNSVKPDAKTTVPNPAKSPAVSDQGNANYRSDSVSLSNAAKALTQIESELKSLPEVDQDRVDAIKAQIDQGTYSIDSNRMAQKMLDLES